MIVFVLQTNGVLPKKPSILQMQSHVLTREKTLQQSKILKLKSHI